MLLKRKAEMRSEAFFVSELFWTVEICTKTVATLPRQLLYSNNLSKKKKKMQCTQVASNTPQPILALLYDPQALRIQVSQAVAMVRNHNFRVCFLAISETSKNNLKNTDHACRHNSHSTDGELHLEEKPNKK